MAKKIILFLGTYNNASVERIYRNDANGIEVKGTQTSEAPVRYFLENYKEVEEIKEIKEIICIVTEASKANGLEQFKEVIKKDTDGKVEVKDIVFNEETDNLPEMIAEIVKNIDSQDEILIDTTGGLRNAILYLMMIVRVLEYKKITLVEAIYVNLGSGKILSIDGTYKLFDLVNGLQEMTNLGSVKSLRKYYGQRDEADVIEKLLSSIENLMENILLCRSANIESSLRMFNEALGAADGDQCKDELMRTLLPAFQNRYGENMDIVSLIRWCLDSDLLQQALTLYTEKIPGYIMDKYVTSYPEENRVPNAEYIDQETAQFNQGICKMKDNIVKKFRLLDDIVAMTSQRLDDMKGKKIHHEKSCS